MIKKEAHKKSYSNTQHKTNNNNKKPNRKRLNYVFYFFNRTYEI